MKKVNKDTEIKSIIDSMAGIFIDEIDKLSRKLEVKTKREDIKILIKQAIDRHD